MAADRVTQLPVMPHSVEAEQAVLGALLLDAAHGWPQVCESLHAEDFHRPDHRLIFAAIAEAQHRGSADLVTVDAVLTERAQIEAAGGFGYLGQLGRDSVGAANIERYAAIVRERAARRRLVELGRRIESDALAVRGEEAETIAAQAAARLAEVQAHSRPGIGLVSMRELAGQLIDDLDARREGRCGLTTGLLDFDSITGGLEAGELTILAGRPGMGKSALMVTVAAHVARDQPVAIFSAEMPSLALARRTVALIGRISQRALRDPRHLSEAEWEGIAHAASRAAERHLWIDDRQLPPLDHIRAECLSRKARGGLSLVLIDYVQLVQAAGSNRYESLREVAYGAKALAKELAAPVVLLAQLNRSVERRDDRRPYLSDLRDSGAIEEAADIVGLLYCEGYYEPEFLMPHVVECNVEKHRHGERGQCLWQFHGEYSQMLTLEDSARAEYRHLLKQQRRRRGVSEEL